MKISVEVMVGEALAPIGLKEIPAGCEFDWTEFVDLNVDLDEDDLIEKLESKGYVVAHEDDVRDPLPREDLRDALTALRKGDLMIARALFDRIFDVADRIVAEQALAGQKPLPLPRISPIQAAA